jgi:BirA family transcriptional regulator, biotin operon repressor / biotin---[acetyl-CoA-carboxylase] ligase
LSQARRVHLSEVGSTQDIARDLPIGSTVVTDHQTAGRGRLGRRWQAPPGTALLASFVLPAHPLASLAAGVAAAEACGPQVRLKWPNDLLVGEAKLGGVLVEAAAGRCIVGIGVNLTASPPGAARLEEPRDRLLDRLEERLRTWMKAEPDQVLSRWRELSATLGRRVRVELGSEVIEGIAEDVAADGSLLVAGRGLVAGDVIHLRAVPPAPEDEAARPRSAP